VHRQLVLRTLQTVQRAGLRLELWCDPVGHRFFKALAQVQGSPIRAQPAGDIGARMHAAFVHHCARSPAPLLLIGTDCPVLDAAHLREAARRLLAGDEAVFTPAEDGGYVLVGLRRPVPELFEDIAWSTAQVMAQTRERLQRLGLRYSEMPTLWDMDRPADWLRWQAMNPQ
jgi:rSAM/selenodomain-associated transferase 1